MRKIFKFFEYGFLLLAIIFIIEGVLAWSSEREKSYLLFGFSVLATFMYLFKRHFRKKFQANNNNRKDQ